jgi:hypothetical protein
MAGIRAALPRVIGNVPAASFELDSRRGYDTLHGSAAHGTMGHRRIAEFLNDLEAMLLIIAFVLVYWHNVL